jgi:predicted heme/steroid binding protein/uncharacterized membrane protein
MKVLSLLLLLSTVTLFPSISSSTPQYAEQTGFDCVTCHKEATGAKLTEAGKDFREGLQAQGLYRPLTPAQKVVRLVIGYLHLLMAIAWFGTILYVHILLKPAYAARGLPKGELILGWLGIIVLSVTGVMLTVARIPSWDAFYTTRFGVLLGLKIILFSIMAATAFIVTFVIGPRLRKSKGQNLSLHKTRLTPGELQQFDGREGRPAYFAYGGKVYDVSQSKLWQEGTHFRKHSAGYDLTDALATAPHGEEKISQMSVAGELAAATTKSSKTAHEKVFYFMAYMNLVFVFLITFIIALWRWW